MKCRQRTQNRTLSRCSLLLITASDDKASGIIQRSTNACRTGFSSWLKNLEYKVEKESKVNHVERTARNIARFVNEKDDSRINKRNVYLAQCNFDRFANRSRGFSTIGHFLR